MKKRKVSPGDGMLLLLPCAALAGFGWWSMVRDSRRPPNDAPRYAPIVEKVSLLPVTPRDVFLGYDTRAEIRVRPSGDTPPPLRGTTPEPNEVSIMTAGLEAKRGSRRKELPLTTFGGGGHEWVEDGQTVGSFAFRLRDVPRDAGQVSLLAKVEERQRFTRMIGGMSSGEYKVLKVVRVPVVLRRDGQTVRVPQVSRYRPFRLESASCQHFPVGAGPLGDVRVTLRFALLPGATAPRGRMRLDELELTDARGRKHTQAPALGGGTQMIPGGYSNGPVTGNALVVTSTFPIAQIPRSAGRLTLKGYASLDDCWPLAVSVEVRSGK